MLSYKNFFSRWLWSLGILLTIVPQNSQAFPGPIILLSTLFSRLQVVDVSTNTIVFDNVSTVDFGTVQQGTVTPVQTFKITNTGNFVALVGPLHVPAGIKVVKQPSLILFARTSTTFQLQLNSSVPITISGVAKFFNTAPGQNPFSFHVTGSVTSSAPKINITQNGVPVVNNQSSFNYGSANVGSTPPTLSFAIMNSGNTSLSVGPITVPNGFSVIQSPTSIPAGTSQNLVIGMNTNAAGNFSGKVVITNSDGTANPFTFGVSGTVVQPAAHLSVSFNGQAISSGQSFDYGSATQGSTPPSKTFVLTNTGNANLNIGQITLPSGFVATHSPASVLAPGASDNLIVQLDTTANVGNYSGSITIPTNDSSASSFLIGVMGSVSAPPTPKMQITNNGTTIGSQSTVTFATVVQGSPSSQTFIVQNTGNAALTVNSIQVTGSFSLQSGLSNSTIQPGTSGSFTVLEDTSSAGSKSGQVTITDNDSTANPFTFLLAGTVTAPRMQLSNNGAPITSGSTLNFTTVTQGASSTQTVTVQNTGNAPLTVSNIQVTGSFSLQSALTNSTIQPGASDSFTLQEDTSSAGSKSGQVTITDNDSTASPFTFSLSGTVNSPASLLVTDNGTTVANLSTDDFGTVTQGTNVAKTFTVQNTGGSTLNLGSVSVGAGFIRTQDFASSTLAPGASENFIIQVDSSTAGMKSAQASFSTNVPGMPTFSFTLTANVLTPPQISVSSGGAQITNGVTTIDFGTVQQSSSAPQKTFSVQNVGGEPLSLGSVSVPSGFTLVTPFSSSSLAPGASDSFVVQMNTTAVGTPSGAITFTNGDSSNSPFSFTVMGSVTTNPCPADGNHGKALIFVDGPIDFTTGAFKTPQEVCLDNLGIYDANGNQIGSNGGVLTGKYSQSAVESINDSASGFPQVNPISSVNNDFRVNYAGDANAPQREAIIWNTEGHLYYWVDDFRKRFLNDQFISDLHLPQQLDQNLRNLQYRPDLNLGLPPTAAKPTLRVVEDFNNDGLAFFPVGNAYNIPLRTRGPQAPFSTLPPLSLGWDAEAFIGDYVGLASFWIIGTNAGFPTDQFFGENNNWQTNMLPALNDGLTTWSAYRYTGHEELFKYFFYAHRSWASRQCGGTLASCDKGPKIRNVMMYDEANTTKNGNVFPFVRPLGSTDADGPTGADLAGMYIGAVFFDIANEAGLGIDKTNLLIWKTISLVTNNSTFAMRDFGTTVQNAARQLWPAGNGLSIYESVINDVLTSRGIPLNGVSDFRNNLPNAAPGNTLRGFRAASSHPNLQPGVDAYGQFNGFVDEYTAPVQGTPDYIAYTFYKHSKYGPCDYVELQKPDGTYTNGIPNPDGTVIYHGEERDMGNRTIFVPNLPGKPNTVRIVTVRKRCDNESQGYYAEDVSPFGYIINQATANGFSFKVTSSGESATQKQYQIDIVDPSMSTLGAATFTWTITDYLGNPTALSGNSVNISVLKDQPFTINITRTRNNQNDTLTLQERGNDFDRTGGTQFVFPTN